MPGSGCQGFCLWLWQEGVSRRLTVNKSVYCLVFRNKCKSSCFPISLFPRNNYKLMLNAFNLEILLPFWASQVAIVVKNLLANAADIRDTGLIPGLGRSPGEGHATHSSILAWRIPWTEEPGGLWSIGSRVWHDWRDLACMHYHFSCSATQSCPILCDPMDWTAACQAFLSITISHSLLKLMSIESVMLSNHLVLCHPLLLLPSIFPSIRVSSNESALHIRWPKYWRFSFSISPSNQYSGLSSFRIDWFDLLAVQGTLKSLLQHHSSKASILWLSAFFIVQLSHPYMTTGKTKALNRQTLLAK